MVHEGGRKLLANYYERIGIREEGENKFVNQTSADAGKPIGAHG